MGKKEKRIKLSLKTQKDFDDLRPYEKLELLGEKALKTSELLAIIIKTGTKQKNAIQLAQEILNMGVDKENLSFLREISLEELKQISGIGRVKAIQIKAIIEFSKRISRRPSKDKIKVKSTTDVVDLFMEEMRYEKQEILKLVILNVKNEILKVQDIFKGNTSSISFDIKNVLSEPVKMQAQRIILLHNHPSGDPTPSNEDIEATIKIKEASKLVGIDLLEHIVIGDGTYKSITVGL